MIGVRPFVKEGRNQSTLRKLMHTAGDGRMGIDWTRAEVVIWSSGPPVAENPVRLTEPIEVFPSDEMIARTALALRSL